MTLRLVGLLVALLLLAPAVASGEALAPYAPAGVAAIVINPLTALVTWAPGTELADSFRVYGIDATGASTLLLDTVDTETPTALTAVVDGGFRTYAVSGVKNAQESGLVLAVAVGCLTIELDPPRISKDCLTKANAGLLAYQLP